MNIRALKQTLSVSLSFLLLSQSAVFAGPDGQNVWTSRNASSPVQENLQLASLPSTFIPFQPSRLTAPRALPSVPSKPRSVRDALSSVRPDHGSVKKLSNSADGPLVVHVRDIHQNLEAQRNIGALLTQLAESGVDLIALEGLSGTLSLEPAKNPVDQDAFDKAVRYALKNGDISGPVYAALQAPEKFPPLVGIENPVLYRQNVQAVREAESLRPVVSPQTNQAFLNLLPQLQAGLNDALLAFENQATLFQMERVSFGDHLRFLSDGVQTASLTLDAYLEALSLEQSMDFDAVRREREAFVRTATPLLSTKELSALFERSLRFQAGQETAASYYQGIKELAQAKGFSLEAYPTLSQYIYYVLLSDTLDASRLFDEKEALEARRRHQLIQTDSEKDLIDARDLALGLRKLVELGLTRPEWEKLSALKKQSSLWQRLKLSPSAYRPFFQFYESALLRDQAMAKNIQAWANENQATTIAVVAGGFHSEGLDAALAKMGFSIAGVDPAIQKVNRDKEWVALSAFTREKTPLEKLAKGSVIFLAPPPAARPGNIPVHMIGASGEPDALAESFSSLPFSEGGKAFAEPFDEDGSAVLVSQNGVSATVSYQKDEQGELISHVEKRAFEWANPWINGTMAPELIAGFVLKFSDRFDGEFGWVPYAFAAAFSFRVLWAFSQILHEAGHALAKSVTDRQPLSQALLETGRQFRLGWVLPFGPVRWPGQKTDAPEIATGDRAAWKVRVKAASGPAATFAAGLGAVYFLMSSNDYLSSLQILTILSFIALQATILLTSWTDFTSFWFGVAPSRLYCGVFGLVMAIYDGGLRLAGRVRTEILMTIDLRDEIPEEERVETGPTLKIVGAKSLLANIFGRLSRQGEHTQVRGRQAGGGLITFINKKGQAIFVGDKFVNVKRANLSALVLGKIKKLVDKAGRNGATFHSSVVALFHWRFGTSSPPSKKETHFHEWVPPTIQNVWAMADGILTLAKENFNVRIVHNGDFDGIAKNLFFGVFGQELKIKEIRETLSRILYPNWTEGDSPKIAGLMTLFTTQGMWNASARLAYLMEIETDLKNPLPHLFEPTRVRNHNAGRPSDSKLPWWERDNGKFIETDPKMHLKVKKMMDELGFVFEEMLPRYAKKIFLPNASSLADVDPEGIEEFIIAVDKALMSNRYAQDWAEDQRRRFIESTIDAFLHNDLDYAMKLYLRVPKSTSSHGLGAVSTLDPEHAYVAAQGQPITIAKSDKGLIMTFASEPAAAQGGLEEDDARLLDLDDDFGEVVKVSATDLEVYSMATRSYLSPEEIENRWIPVKNNKYLDEPESPSVNEDLVDQDVNVVTRVLRRIRKDFRKGNSWNRETANNLMTHFIQRARANQLKEQSSKVVPIIMRDEKDRTSTYEEIEYVAAAAPHLNFLPMTLNEYMEFVEKTKVEGHRDHPHEVDLVLIGEEKSYETAKRFERDLRAIVPTMKAITLSGNKYLKNQAKLYANGIIGKNTVIMGISQSGQTFPTLKAVRHAERARKAGRLGDVFVLTGEWYSKMGQALGQKYHPDDPFTGRIFSNMTGRRRAEAATVGFLSTDYVFTEILIHMAKTLRSEFPDAEPFNMTASLQDIEVLEQEADFYIDVSLQGITGRDGTGERVQSPVHQDLVAGGRRWANHLIENFTAKALLIPIVIITVSTGWYPSTLILYALGGLTGAVSTPLSAALFAMNGATWTHVFDAFIYAFLYWIIVGALRVLQGRELFSRTGVRNITIMSPVGGTLRNYVKRLFGEAPGDIQPRVDEASAEDLVNYEAASVARGGLFFAQLDNDLSVAQSQKQELAAGKMAISQANGIQNFGSGLEIMVQHFDLEDHLKFPSITLRTRQQLEERGASSKKDNINEVISSRYRHPEMLAAGYVFFHAMAEKASRFDINLYARRNNSPLQYMIWIPFEVVSYAYSRVFMLGFSLFHKVFLGTNWLYRLYVPGATQSGTAIATTQMTPDNTSEDEETEQINLKKRAKAIRAKGIDGRRWVPQSEGNRVPYFLAAIYEPREISEESLPNAYMVIDNGGGGATLQILRESGYRFGDASRSSLRSPRIKLQRGNNGSYFAPAFGLSVEVSGSDAVISFDRALSYGPRDQLVALKVNSPYQVSVQRVNRSPQLDSPFKKSDVVNPSARSQAPPETQVEKKKDAPIIPTVRQLKPARWKTLLLSFTLALLVFFQPNSVTTPITRLAGSLSEDQNRPAVVQQDATPTEESVQKPDSQPEKSGFNANVFEEFLLKLNEAQSEEKKLEREEESAQDRLQEARLKLFLLKGTEGANIEKEAEASRIEKGKELEQASQALKGAREKLDQAEAKARAAQTNLERRERLGDLLLAQTQAKEIEKSVQLQEKKLADIEETLQAKVLAGAAGTRVKTAQESQEQLKRHVNYYKRFQNYGLYVKGMEDYGVAFEVRGHGLYWKNPFIPVSEENLDNIYSVDQVREFSQEKLDALGIRVRDPNTTSGGIAVYGKVGGRWYRAGAVLKGNERILVLDEKVYIVRVGVSWYEDALTRLLAQDHSQPELEERARVEREKLNQFQKRLDAAREAVSRLENQFGPIQIEELEGAPLVDYEEALERAAQDVEEAANLVSSAEGDFSRAEQAWRQALEDETNATARKNQILEEIKKAENQEKEARQDLDEIRQRREEARVEADRLQTALDELPQPLSSPEMNSVQTVPEVSNPDGEPIEQEEAKPEGGQNQNVIAAEKDEERVDAPGVLFAGAKPHASNLKAEADSVKPLSAFRTASLADPVFLAALTAVLLGFGQPRRKKTPGSSKPTPAIPAEKWAQALNGLAETEPVKETDETALILNEILFGAERPLGLEDPLAFETAEAYRSDLLAKLAKRVAYDPAFVEELQSELNNPTTVEAVTFLTSVLHGPGPLGVGTVPFRVPNAKENQLTVVAIRSLWWDLMSDDLKRVFLKSLLDSRSHLPEGLKGKIAIATETTDSALEVFEWIQNVGGETQLQLIGAVDDMYQPDGNGVALNLGVLTKALKETGFPVEAFTSYRLIASPSSMNDSELDPRSPFMNAIVNVIDESLRLVGSGKARDLANVDKIARMIGTKA